MLVGVLAFGILSGLLAAAMVLGSVGSFLMAFLAYSVFGTLGAILCAMAIWRYGPAHAESVPD